MIPFVVWGAPIAEAPQPKIIEEQVTATSTDTVVTKPEPIEVIPESDTWISEEGRQVVEERFGEGHPLVAVAQCESGFKQFKSDGTLLENPDPKSSAAGVFQTLLITHGPKARSMGMDLETWEGNMDFAEYLYEINGLKDWKESKPCWKNLI